MYIHASKDSKHKITNGAPSMKLCMVSAPLTPASHHLLMARKNDGIRVSYHKTSHKKP